MRVVALAIGTAVVFVTHAAAATDARFQRGLMMLAPTERLEQLCDYTAMTQIRKDQRQFRPDRAVAGAMGEPHAVNAHTIEAKGAAFRSRGKWYALTYRCSADIENLKVISFRYTVGEEIPETKWTAYGLWE
ncbi:MAG: DUF930 domain-containing protein [Pseudolabrys sp.]